MRLLPASPADAPDDADEHDTNVRRDLAALISTRQDVNITDGGISGTEDIVTAQCEQPTQEQESEMLDISIEVAANDDELVARGWAAGTFGEPKTAEQAAMAGKPWSGLTAEAPPTPKRATAKPAQAAKIYQTCATLKRSLTGDVTQTVCKRPRKGDNFPPDDTLIKQLTGTKPSFHTRLVGDLAWRKLLATHAFDKACHNYRPLGQAQQPSIELATAAFQLFYIYCGSHVDSWRRHASNDQ